MSNIAVEILVLLLLLLLNGVFVVSEIAVLSARKTKLQQQSNEGDKPAGTALGLAQNPNVFLSTVQIGITLVGVLLGAVSGEGFSRPLAELFKRWPLLIPYADSLALGIAVVLITTLTVLIGELVPKRLALYEPEKIAAATAGPMIFLSKLFSPLIWLLNQLTDLIIRMMGIRPGDPTPVTEEEIQLLIDQGTEAGVIEEAEQDMV
ncbi:MAG: DUF21 domain-containing protein, partial [Chloroflexi bacterium]|nr:DUF21 domain-containing protein [Chloroflexota bacterium]